MAGYVRTGVGRVATAINRYMPACLSRTPQVAKPVDLQRAGQSGMMTQSEYDIADREVNLMPHANRGKGISLPAYDIDGTLEPRFPVDAGFLKSQFDRAPEFGPSSTRPDLARYLEAFRLEIKRPVLFIGDEMPGNGIGGNDMSMLPIDFSIPGLTLKQLGVDVDRLREQPGTVARFKSAAAQYAENSRLADLIRSFRSYLGI